MPALKPRRTRIHQDHIQPVIMHNSQYVRVSANKDIWLVTVDELESIVVVMARIAAYVGHKDTLALTLEKAMDGIVVYQAALIAVSDDTHQRFILRNGCGDAESPAEIPGMPYFIAILEKIAELRSENSMSIGQKTYFHTKAVYIWVTATRAAVSVRRRDGPRCTGT